MNIVAIIQARTGSTRLPEKVLLDLEGKTVLEHVVERVSASKNIHDVVVATTINKEDLEIVKICSNLGISVYCGSEEDVLDRYYQVARLFKVDHIVRITSDCPMIDPKIIDDVINLHLQENADYTTNTLNETYPDGQDVEVITFDALKKAWKNADLASEREHVAPYIRFKPHIFKHSSLDYKQNLSQKRWTLDNREDYELINKIYKNLYHINNLFGMEEILAFLHENPDIEKINEHINRNEGYLKSLKEDKNVNLDDTEE